MLILKSCSLFNKVTTGLHTAAICLFSVEFKTGPLDTGNLSKLLLERDDQLVISMDELKYENLSKLLW